MTPSDEAYQAVLEELGKMAQAWVTFREVVNRAINMLNHEVIELRERVDKDDEARVERQAQLDQKLDEITHGQAAIRRWQYIRVIVEIVAVLVVLAAIAGKLWL